MLSISLVQGDGSYYTAGGEPARWWGDAVPLLGLPRTVDPDRFKNLLKGLTPDGNHRLLPPHPRRDAGWDLTFSAPKSVSVLRAFVDEKTRARIDACHEGAVAAALRLVQSQAGFTRRGQGGATREPAAMLFMLLKHEVSRDFDPQLHTHAVAINLAVREDRTCGAIHSVLLYRVKMLAGAVYQAELAHSLARNLGLQIEPTRVAFRIRGVPRDLCRAFSKRRIAVEAKLDDRSTARDAHAATQHTRPAKAAFDLTVLRQKWEKEAGTFLWGRDQAEKLLGSGVSKDRGVAQASGTISRESASDSAPPPSAKAKAEPAPHMSRLHGDAVTLLGLPRKVGPEVFTNLFEGKSPDGKTQLVAQQRLRDMVQPLSFTIPKSLSVVRVLASDENRRGIDDAHNTAVAMALRYLQTQAGFTLSNQVGPSVQPAALLFKLSTHELTEDLRPQLMTHALPINLAVRADKTCGPVLQEFFDRARHIAQAVYLTELAKRLNIELGLEVVPTLDGFHVRGVPQKLCNALLNESVQPSGVTKAKISASVAEAPPGTLFASGEKLHAGLRRGWEQTAARYSWSTSQADRLINRHIYREPDLEGFYRRLADDVRHLPVSRRSADSTINLARRLALESSVGGVQMLRTMGQIKEYREPLYQVRWLRMFPKAPFWSPASLVKKPVILAGGRPRHWGRVIRRKEIMNLEVRVQMRRLFPRLPAWHPASKLQLPAIRVAIPEAKQRYIIEPERGLSGG